MAQIEKPEKMGAFFDVRADGYDTYMRDTIFPDATFMQFYSAVSSPIEQTDEPIDILDLGCGTGLELEGLLKRAPNAQITGVDVSKRMLDLLRSRYQSHMSQIRLVKESYLAMPFGEQMYDYVISAKTAHHIKRDTKLELYRKIRVALKPGGRYIEGDSVIPVEMEGQFLAEFHEQVDLVPAAEDGHYHIDVPFSIDTQRGLLLEAGFKEFEVVFQLANDPVWQVAVYVAST